MKKAPAKAGAFFSDPNRDQLQMYNKNGEKEINMAKTKAELAASQITKALELMNKNALGAAENLLAIANDPEAPLKQKIEANRIILEYVLGKPNQNVNMAATVDKPLTVNFEGVLDEWSK